eukprot:NODE_1995_length_1165_cov_60.437380_g1978_i0.p1 GENE.NODE_1995_length_1165_cov_60.437380_g1978_i0~~NODE_1995_length_1165_cov_60.437380_g1978_i0.p1  ORF type:complete len:364 (-),score=79.89 NODE_1995_length_1165_cov_60.437380_g1978_i0:73-1137(-)
MGQALALKLAGQGSKPVTPATEASKPATPIGLGGVESTTGEGSMSTVTLATVSTAPEPGIEECDDRVYDMVEGVVEVSGVRVPVPGEGYRLEATVPDAGDVFLRGLSDPFLACGRLTFSKQPPFRCSTLSAFTTSLQIVDSKGRQVPRSTCTVGLSIRERDAPDRTGTLRGDALQRHEESRSQFDFYDLRIDTPASGYVLWAESNTPAVLPAFSDPITSVAQLKFTTFPDDTTQVWRTFSVQVEVVDADSEQHITTTSPFVTLSLGSGSPSHRLGGRCVRLQAMQGVALFRDLLVDTAGVYTIVATADNEAIRVGNSPAFNVHGTMLMEAAKATNAQMAATADTVGAAASQVDA